MSQSYSKSSSPLLDSVLDRVGIDIITGEIPEGTVFRLSDLTDEFGISRTVAREVMRALEQRGMVMSSRRVGITVTPREEWSNFDSLIIQWRLNTRSERTQQLRALNELRLAIEPLAARIAARQASTEQRERLRILAADLVYLGAQRKGTSQQFLDADCEFHSIILDASDNPMFSGIKPLLLMVLQARTKYGLQPATPVEGTTELHQKLAHAIYEKNEEESERLAREILSEVQSSLGF